MARRCTRARSVDLATISGVGSATRRFNSGVSTIGSARGAQHVAIDIAQHAETGVFEDVGLVRRKPPLASRTYW